MSQSFKNRVFGCAIIKSINSNYNADFTHQPRTLPDGTVYATDKALKYSIRNYWKVQGEKVFYFKSLSDDMQPRDLDQRYESLFSKYPDIKGKDRKADLELIKPALSNLLSCIDIKTFGATFASQKSLPSDKNKKLTFSLHGTVQFTHGVNRFPEGIIYSEQISSPFRNSNDKSADSMQTTLGTQFKLREGHYVHHLSVNPRNLEDMATLVSSDGVTDEDIVKLKQALRSGVTLYDSSAKAGTENELLLWVQLKTDSKLVLPSFVELVSVTIGENENRQIDLTKISAILGREHIKSQIEKIELYYDQAVTTVLNTPEGAEVLELN